MSEQRNLPTSERYLIGMGAKRRLTLFLSYFTNKGFPVIFSEDPLKLHQCSLGWEFSLRDELQDVKHRSDLIKHGTNIFKICSPVDLPSAYTDLDLGFYTNSFMTIEFIKRSLSCDKLFSIDSNDPHIFLSLCWTLTKGWIIWGCIIDIRDFKIFIIQ